MKIDVTAISVASGEAKIICSREKGGLIGYIFDKINKRSIDVIKGVNLFYHPVYYAIVELRFSRSCINVDVYTVLDFVSMLGSLGQIRYIEKIPSAVIADVQQNVVAVLQYDEIQAIELISAFFKKKTDFASIVFFPITLRC